MVAKTNRFEDFVHVYQGCLGKLVVDNGDLVCTSCGASRRVEAENERPRNAGLTSDTRSYFNLGTTVPSGITHFRPRYESYRSLRAARLDEMIEMVSRPLGLSSGAKIIAARLGRKLLSGSSLRRASLQSVCIYCVVQASRETGTHRTLGEILEAFKAYEDTSPSKTFREFNKITRQSSIEYRNASAEDYIKLIVNRLSRKLGDEVYLRAVFRKSSDHLLAIRLAVVGKNPWCVAAYCIYHADMDLGYKIGLDQLCSFTRLSPERLLDLEEKVRQSLHSNGRTARRPDRVGEDAFRAEARSFRMSLRRSR
ncbi:MAG: hypothetical protein ABSA72_02085 [Nitrososphaerales archaeon]|jgi:transcription initiation factor TFIIIB Brf1 subunit/transcription initiation factor TFIIB